jgi:CTP:molybdopterin cytidylyltransferase MocA
LAVEAVILAGAPAEPELNPGGEPISRAMLEIGDKTMLQWLVDALKSASTVSSIWVVGKVTAEGIDQVIEPKDTFLDNVMLAMNASSGDRVLLSSCDIPLVFAEAIDDFVTKGLKENVDFCFPIIPKDQCLAKYPELKRTYAKTREGAFTGGNMVLVSREFMLKNEKIIGEVYAQRKKVTKLAGIIGFGVLIKAILAQIAFPALLPIPMLEQTVAKMLGGSVKAVVTNYPEIGEDVDKPGDLAYVRELLRKP